MFLVVMVVLSATPVKVASTDWNFSGLEPQVANALESRFLSLLSDEGFRITSSKDVAALLGLERQKQLLGCSVESCIGELAGALGVDAILTASVVKVGNSFTVSMRVSSASNALPISSLSTRVASLEALQDWLDGAAKTMAAQLRSASGEAPAAAVQASGGKASKVIPWIPAMAGAALAIGGAVIFVSRDGPARQLQTATFPDAAAVSATRTQGETFEKAGIAMMATSGAAVVASVLWFALAPSNSVSVAVAPTRDGAVFGLGGSFP